MATGRNNNNNHCPMLQHHITSPLSLCHSSSATAAVCQIVQTGLVIISITQLDLMKVSTEPLIATNRRNEYALKHTHAPTDTLVNRLLSILAYDSSSSSSCVTFLADFTLVVVIVVS